MTRLLSPLQLSFDLLQPVSALCILPACPLPATLPVHFLDGSERLVWCWRHDPVHPDRSADVELFASVQKRGARADA